MKSRLIASVTALLFGLSLGGSLAFAAEDEYWEWIVWWGGAGKKNYVTCDVNGYFANGMQNYDHGRHNQSVYMNCNRIDTHLDIAPPVNSQHRNCIQIGVTWYGGKGDKPWAHCPDGKYAAGFQLQDFGKNNQAVTSMRCCGIAETGLTHGDSYPEIVDWYGGEGPKTQSKCAQGYYITGLRNKDWGKNDQSVSEIRCTRLVTP